MVAAAYPTQLPIVLDVVMLPAPAQTFFPYPNSKMGIFVTYLFKGHHSNHSP
jgi:hypothetical protein